MRFFTSISLIFLISNQADAIWPFTASDRSSNVPETSTQAAPTVVQAQSFYDGPSMYDFRNAPSGFFEFPHITTFLKPSYQQVQQIEQQQQQQQQQQQEDEQQIEQTPVNNGGTKGGNGNNTPPPTKGSFFHRFWRHQRKPSTIVTHENLNTDPLNTASASNTGTTGSVIVPNSGEPIIENTQETFANSGFLEPIRDGKHPTRATPWNWIFWNPQHQPVESTAGVVPIGGTAQPVEVASSDPHPVHSVPSSHSKRQFLSLPQFPSFPSFPSFNIFPNRKPVVSSASSVTPQTVQGVPVHSVNGEHCQCWQTGQGPHPQQQFGFPAPFPGGYPAPGVVATEAFPTAVFDNLSPQQQQQQQQQQHHHHHVQGQGPYSQNVPQSEGNVKVVVSGADHSSFESAPVATKVAFPSSSEGGSSNEPIAAESSADSSSVVVVPSPSSTPVTNSASSTSDSPSNESTSSNGTPPAKATTFSGTVPGGSTTPQEMKGKQFSIGKSKFTASVAAKNNKKN